MKDVPVLDALDARLRQESIPFALPESKEYEKRRRILSPRAEVQFKPALIACPDTVEQVSAVIRAAKGFCIVAKSGGHSSRGLSLGGKDGAVVIDMAAFTRLDVDKEQQVAHIGPANRLGPVYLALNEYNQSISAGSCPAVGFGGLAAHGGIHTSHRTHGMTCDAVIAYEAVLADGSIVHVKEGDDLFWALRGNASSFAIVTDFTCKTWTPPPRNVRFDLVYRLPVEDATQAWLALQEWAHSEHAIREFGNVSFTIVRPDPKDKLSSGFVQVVIFGNFLGEEALFRQHFDPLAENLPKPLVSNIQAGLAWIDVLDKAKVALPEGVGLDLKGYDERFPWHEKSLILTEDLSKAAITQLLDYASKHHYEDLPSFTLTCIGVSLSGGYDTAIRDTSPDTSSVPRRHLEWDIWIAFAHQSSEPEYHNLTPDQCTFVNDLFAIFEKHLGDSDWGSYRNYADVDMPDWQLRYYGGNWSHLQELKRRYDPDNIFSAPLGVTP